MEKLDFTTRNIGYLQIEMKIIPDIKDVKNLSQEQQKVRLIFAEQFYRALSILNNLPYHHN